MKNSCLVEKSSHFTLKPEKVPKVREVLQIHLKIWVRPSKHLCGAGVRRNAVRAKWAVGCVQIVLNLNVQHYENCGLHFKKILKNPGIMPFESGCLLRGSLFALSRVTTRKTYSGQKLELSAATFLRKHPNQRALIKLLQIRKAENAFQRTSSFYSSEEHRHVELSVCTELTSEGSRKNQIFQKTSVLKSFWKPRIRDANKNCKVFYINLHIQIPSVQNSCDIKKRCF